MYRGHTVGVVIPAYNEESFVGPTIESVPDFVDRVYPVDDGSTDATWEEITSTSERENDRLRRTADTDLVFEERIVPIAHEQNRGVGGAIKTGYLAARDDGIDVTLVMGGDGQMEPELVGTLCDPIIDGEADYVKGNRFIDRLDRGSMPAFRFVGNSILNSLTKIASGYWQIGDPQSGFTAISLHALETAAIEDMYEFYGYCNDLLVKLNVAGLRVVDIPRPITYGDEESHIRYRTYIPRVSGMLFRNFVWRLRTKYLTFDFHPLVVAYLTGGVATSAGLFGVLRSLLGGRSDETSDTSGLVGLLLGVVGVLSFVAAMVLDKRENDSLNAVYRPEETDHVPTSTHEQFDADGLDESTRTPTIPAVGGNGSASDEEYAASAEHHRFIDTRPDGSGQVAGLDERGDAEQHAGGTDFSEDTTD